jgi:hypothetical protein
VQEKASQATDLAKQKAPVLKDKVAGATHKASRKGDQGAGSGDLGSNGVASSGTGGLGSAAGGVDDATSEEGAIIVTAPPPSPLEPGATSENPTSGGLGG